MSAHFSKWGLNSYSCEFFKAHIPDTYPLGLVLIGSRTFHGLPPRLRELARLSKQWMCLNYPYPAGIHGIEQWYDEEGFELDPGSGRRLTPEEIAAEWPALGYGPPDEPPPDIPEPPGGFADPARWQPPPRDEPILLDREGLTEERIFRDIAGRGRERTADEYGVPRAWLGDVKTDRELAALILGMDCKPPPEDSGLR